jgi:hypothetical protein
MGDERALRLAQNEGIMRQVNERIGEIAEGLGGGDHRYDFLCECAQLDCVQRISLTLAEYGHVREKGDRFAVIAGHEVPDVEDVVEKFEEYWIVEKVGVAGEVAREEDPRSE